MIGRTITVTTADGLTACTGLFANIARACFDAIRRFDGTVSTGRVERT